MHYKNYLILYGGILEVTKETQDMYALDLSTYAWVKIDPKGPCNLKKQFTNGSRRNVVKEPTGRLSRVVSENAIEEA